MYTTICIHTYSSLIKESDTHDDSSRHQTTETFHVGISLRVQAKAHSDAGSLSRERRLRVPTVRDVESNFYARCDSVFASVFACLFVCRNPVGYLFSLLGGADSSRRLVLEAPCKKNS